MVSSRLGLEMLTKYSEALGVNKSTIMYFDEEGEKIGYNYQHLLLINTNLFAFII